MMHLTNYIKGDAARTIQGLHVSAGNYNSAVKMLKDRYNRSDLIIASHLKSLRSLPMVKASHDVAGLRHLYTEIDVHTRGLSEQGQDSATYGVFLATMLFEKFPPDLQLEWISNARNKITNFDGLVQFLKKAVEARERCNSYAPSVSSTATQPESHTAARRPYEFRKPAVPTAAGLMSTVQARVCIFCNASHSNFNCPLAVNEKRRLVNVKRLCLNCFQQVLSTSFKPAQATTAAVSAEGLITRPFIKTKHSSNNSKGQSGSHLNSPGSNSSKGRSNSKFNSRHHLLNSPPTKERFLESQHSSSKAQVVLLPVKHRSSLQLEL